MEAKISIYSLAPDEQRGIPKLAMKTQTNKN